MSAQYSTNRGKVFLPNEERRQSLSSESGLVCLFFPYYTAKSGKVSFRKRQSLSSTCKWVWNLRLEVGREIEPAPVRTTEFAAAIPPQNEQAAARPPSSPPTAGYGPPTSATRLGKQGASPEPTFRSSRMARFSTKQGSRFASRSGVRKGTEVCAWSMRPVFATAVPGRMPRTVSMEWQRHREAAPGQRALASAAGWFCPTAATRDWSRRVHRRACMQLVRY